MYSTCLARIVCERVHVCSSSDRFMENGGVMGLNKYCDDLLPRGNLAV